MRTETDLEMAERHVARGDAIVEDQRSLVARLSEMGLATTLAEDLLKLFLKVQRQHVAHRDRLLRG